MTTTYILALEAWGKPGEDRREVWTVRCRDDASSTDRGEMLACTPDVLSDGSLGWIGAQAWATRILHRVAVRTVAWDAHPSQGHDVYFARVYDWYDQARVTEYEAPDGRRYHAAPGGVWTNHSDPIYPNLAALERHVGPLIPRGVSSLAALLAERDIMRAVAVAHFGPIECAEGDCDEYADADAAGHPIELCSHMRPRVATIVEARSLDRIKHLLDDDMVPGHFDIDDLLDDATADPALRQRDDETRDAWIVRTLARHIRKTIDQEDLDA